MRIRISHATTYAYNAPPTLVTQVLRLTPRDHDGQHVLAFGNIIHSFTAEGPFSELTVAVDGEVDTQDTDGLVSGALERFPPEFYLRETSLTQVNAAIIEFAQTTRAAT
jgi:transglutaminase-like putative cysteine protease